MMLHDVGSELQISGLTLRSLFLHASNVLLWQLRAARLEIRDLQAEFEVERNDYLATVRRLEREGHLLHDLLERMVTLVRRDCNYSNLDRLKKEAVWDEDSGTWRLPDVTVQKTMLPSGATCEKDMQKKLF